MFDAARYANAARNREFKPRPVKTPTRQAFNGDPCRKCGASGWKGCQHQLAADPVIVKAKEPELHRGDDNKLATPEECRAALEASLAFIERNCISENRFIRMVAKMSQGGHNFLRAFAAGSAKRGSIRRVYETIAEMEGACHA